MIRTLPTTVALLATFAVTAWSAPLQPATTAGDTVWFDDALPMGAVGSGTNGEGWKWVNKNPSPYSGNKSHLSLLASGPHQHAFNNASVPFGVTTGGTLFTYVYLDPANPPSEVMLSWCRGTTDWEHRAYWGANQLTSGVNGTASRYYVGPLPATGKWVRLEIPASVVGLDGASLQGMGFALYNGRAAFDCAGKGAGSTTSGGTTSGGTTSGTSTSSTGTTTTSGGTTSGGTTSGTSTSSTGTTTTGTTSGGTTTGTTSTGTTSTPTTAKVDTVWINDALPVGAGGMGSTVDTWNWVSAPVYSGTLAHRSAAASGLHEHWFGWSNNNLPIATGDTLFTYIYLDPANVPSEVMLSWSTSSSWEHRAYWGADLINRGTGAGHYYAGALPAAGGWVRLEVPASAVGLEGSAVTAMNFSLYNGAATWDASGKAGIVTMTDPAIAVATTLAPTTTGTLVSTVGRVPQVGDYELRVLTPTVLELRRVLVKPADPATFADWNFVSSTGAFTAPSVSEFAVTANGAPVAVSTVAFRRISAFAQLNVRDLRVEASLYLTLTAPIAEGQAVEVKNPSGLLWPATMKFTQTAAPLRYNPALHVNQQGYLPSLSKKAMVGYYLGNGGELPIGATKGFRLVTASTGVTVFTGSLTHRVETGYETTPLPYQAVYEADFSAFTTPGEYQLVVPGMGASLPFLINDGVAMAFARTYELGLYHQRCGGSNDLPFTRFTHGVCHLPAAEVPTSDPAYTITWNTIASYSGGNATQTAPQLVSAATQLYPFVNQGLVDVAGGHHDAGDYSKYTIDVALLVHQLMFTADSIQRAAALDNLGIPESGDGISDILQEAKWEADYLAKLQDADGGFYFIVYPKTREYEGDVLPDHGDTQVVWPKNTSATAAAVAALAQCASSPLFKQTYPTVAANYLAKAKLGWQFLMNAHAKYGKAGAYQKVTFYGDEFNDNDELSWAACQMYLATGDTQYQQKLFAWFPNPADPSTFHWSWQRLYQGYGAAIRSYAFAARSGRLLQSQLDPTYLSACEGQVIAAAEDNLAWTTGSAYGTSFPANIKHAMQTGWWFSLDQASDMAVAYQINGKQAYIDALLTNMNYEGGANPINVSFVAGLGVKRPQNMVSQYANNDRRVLPPDGEPMGNVHHAFAWLSLYGSELSGVTFPDDGVTGSSYVLQDRFTDVWNVMTEFITLNQARGLTSVAFLSTLTPAKSTAWKPAATLKIVSSAAPVVGQPMTMSFDPTGLDLTGARVTWEANGQQPGFGSTYTVTPAATGIGWVEVEVTWPDGRRLFGTGGYYAP